MTAITSAVTQIISALAIIAQIGVVFLFALILAHKFKKAGSSELKYFGDKAILFAFIISLSAIIGSLFYSEVAGFEPCVLCWYQRIFMYPQVLLLGVALIKKDKGIVDYSLWMSLAGAAIAAYHYLLQIDSVSGLPCSAVGVSISCTQRPFMTFGYITIPMMALSAFLLIAGLMFANRAFNHPNR